MTYKRQEFLSHAHLDEATLQIWLHEEWLIPAQHDSDEAWVEADIARAKLIQDLRQHMGVNDQGVSIVLHLLDQLHDMRRAMDRLASDRS